MVGDWRGDNSICFPHAKNVPIPPHKMDKKRLKANRLESFCVLGQFSREKQQSIVRGKWSGWYIRKIIFSWKVRKIYEFRKRPSAWLCRWSPVASYGYEGLAERYGIVRLIYVFDASIGLPTKMAEKFIPDHGGKLWNIAVRHVGNTGKLYKWYTIGICKCVGCHLPVFQNIVPAPICMICMTHHI